MKRDRYFIQIGEGPSREVTLEEWIKYERQAGFYGSDGKRRTAGFTGNNIHGHIRDADETYCAACSGHGTNEHDDNCPEAFQAWLDKGRDKGWIIDKTYHEIRYLETGDLDDLRAMRAYE